MAAPMREPISLCITLYSPFLQPNRPIKDFHRYGNDSGGFLVALVIRRCVNATEATMETARSVEEGWREVKASVGC